MNSDDLPRRDLMKALAAGTARLLPVFPLAGAAAPADKAAGWKPRFFSEPDAELVAGIAELIIPRTDTPGARDARVHEHIDLVLSEETLDVQEEFQGGLRWINHRSRELYQKEFRELSGVQQNELLSRIANSKDLQPADEPGNRFFLDIRKRVVFAYYTSRIGLEQELTYKGGQVLGHWEGCPHPDHHGDAA